MNERPDNISTHQANINMAIWFFRALDTCMQIQDPHLRSRAINECVEAHRICRGPDPIRGLEQDLSFLNKDRGDQITRRQ